MNKYLEALNKVRNWQNLQLHDGEIPKFFSETEEYKLMEELGKKQEAEPVIVDNHSYQIKRGKGYQHQVVTLYYCPDCGNKVQRTYCCSSVKADYCPYCFKKLDWSVLNESEDDWEIPFPCPDPIDGDLEGL